MAAELGGMRQIIFDAIEQRRGLVAFSKMQALEMDRLAREYERQALERLREALRQRPAEGVLVNVRERLTRMDEQIEELERQGDIAETSRTLQRDDITWRTFEDLAALLGVEG